MFKFIKQEWKYWLTSPMTWIFLFINTMLVMGAVSSDNINIGGGVGSVHKNAPYVVQTYYGVMSLICLLMTTAFMNSSANRDFSTGMFQFVFTSPIKKRDYYFGKFIGAASMAVVPLLGVTLGSLIGPYMPWAQPERYGDVVWAGHWQGIISFGIPNTIIAASLLYTLAVIFRNNLISFVGAMLILILYVVSSGFTKDIEKEWLANLLDPFGFRPESIVAKYMTVDEKNISPVPLAGAFLINRLIWIGISVVILLSAYFKFSFSIKNQKVKKEKKQVSDKVATAFTDKIFIPSKADSFSFSALWYLIKFETKSVIKNPTFIIIVILGLLNLIASLSSFTGRYGVDQYPVTYDVIDTIKGSFYLFLIAIITFYAGVLVWKERDAKINEIQDATPIKTSQLFISKLIAMIIAVALVLVTTIVIGIFMQTLFGFTNYKIDVYIKSLLIIDLLFFSCMIVIALLFHYILNNRYIAYFAFITFAVLNSFIWGVLEIDTNMVKFGNAPSVTYSDMNGFGPFVSGVAWFKAYWFLFCVVFSFVIYAFYVRGKELAFSARWKHAKNVLSKTKLVLSLSIIALISCGAYVYYNTKVLNKYISSDEEERRQVEYERKYKKYEGITQPRFYKYYYNIDIMPDERSMKANIKTWVRNISNKPIKEIHFTMPSIPDTVLIRISNATLKQNDGKLSYRIYALNKPLQPNDSLEINFDVARITKGFENEVSFTQLTQNGTFFNNMDFVPRIGYQTGDEISDKNKRKKYNLPYRKRMPSLNENDSKNCANNYIRNDADWVEVNTTISTNIDQIAIAPGSLIKSWEANGRKYFNYKLDKQSLDFYSFISAKYEVARKKWKGIDIEVYYVEEHEYNVPNMLKSLEKSLEYYTQNFGPYFHKQARIIEFPGYQSFAQAFPGTMPYSEAIGFIIDLREVTQEDIDQVYYVVAHEMGHQYWAHQLCGAEMQGSEMMSEGFAQYSALMVMEKEYGKDKMKKFLSYEMDGYLRGRSTEFEAERPLYKSEHQQYIHYQKASVVMYYLKEMIGEKKVNEALHNLLDSFAYALPPYATSLAAIREFRKVTPDTLQYLMRDLFETITLFSNRTVTANYKKLGKYYEVTIETSSEKFSADSLGKESAKPIADYIDIGIFAAPLNKKNLGKALVYQRLKIDKKENTFTFKTTEEPYQVGIDPYNYLIDRLPEDNVKKLTLLQ